MDKKPLLLALLASGMLFSCTASAESLEPSKEEATTVETIPSSESSSQEETSSAETSESSEESSTQAASGWTITWNKPEGCNAAVSYSDGSHPTELSEDDLELYEAGKEIKIAIIKAGGWTIDEVTLPDHPEVAIEERGSNAMQAFYYFTMIEANVVVVIEAHK